MKKQLNGKHTPRSYNFELPNRFWDKVEKTDSCWNWTGSINQSNYGKFWLTLDGKGSTQYAHRVAFWATHKREIMPGMELDHVCCNSKCVNPAHIVEVTPEQNNRLRILRRAVKGEMLQKVMYAA